MIIVIEGTDAAGKKTQSELLAERLKGTRFAFPNYESETGKAILGNLKQDWMVTDLNHAPCTQSMPQLNALVFQCLQSANRLELIPKIHEAMMKGPVIFDRYYHSGIVYGLIDGLDQNWLETVLKNPMPPADIHILLDVPVEEGFKRRPERRDRYETDKPFLEKVRAEYLEMWKISGANNPGWADEYQSKTWYLINGLGTVEEVHKRIMAILPASVLWGQKL